MCLQSLLLHATWDIACCSCATLKADYGFALTSNLAATESFQVLLLPAQQGRPVHGAVLHNSW